MTVQFTKRVVLAILQYRQTFIETLVGGPF